jgi:hypothetical protein
MLPSTRGGTTNPGSAAAKLGLTARTRRAARHGTAHPHPRSEIIVLPPSSSVMRTRRRFPTPRAVRARRRAPRFGRVWVEVRTVRAAVGGLPPLRGRDVRAVVGCTRGFIA